MESTHQAALTPEQIAAINAGGGFAHCEDPTSHVHYHLIQYEPPTHDDDDYIREKLAEAQADIDRGDVAEWNLAEIKRDLHEHLAKKQAGE
jgi:hypothetical protein